MNKTRNISNKLLLLFPLLQVRVITTRGSTGLSEDQLTTHHFTISELTLCVSGLVFRLPLSSGWSGGVGGTGWVK